MYVVRLSRGCNGCFCLKWEAWSCRCSCMGSVSVLSCRCGMLCLVCSMWQSTMLSSA